MAIRNKNIKLDKINKKILAITHLQSDISNQDLVKGLENASLKLFQIED